MLDNNIRKVTGWSGLLFGIGTFAMVPLYFVYSGPPPASNVLTRNLITLIASALLLLFFNSLSHLIRRARADTECLASLIYGAALLFLSITFIAAAMETGVVFSTPDGTVDPTIDGPLAAANVLMHGSIKRLLSAVTLLAAGYALLRTHVLPRWTGWTAYFVALCNLAFVPSLYFGTDVTRFYSAHGWGNSALVGSLIGYWVFAVGIAALRRPPVAASIAEPLRESGSRVGTGAI